MQKELNAFEMYERKKENYRIIFNLWALVESLSHSIYDITEIILCTNSGFI